MAFLLVVSIAAFAYEPTLTGRWGNIVTAVQSPSLADALHFATLIDLDYELHPLTFGFTATSQPAYHGLTPIGSYATKDLPWTLFFDMYGTLGAYSMASDMWFDVEDDGFQSWITGWWFDLGGLELFGMAFIDGDTQTTSLLNPFTGLHLANSNQHPLHGAGWTIGGAGYAGPVALSFEVGFNALSPLLIFNEYGTWTEYSNRIHDELRGDSWEYDQRAMGTWNPFRELDCDDSLQYTVYSPQVQTDGCRTVFSFLDIKATIPFCCASVGVDLSFSEHGFEHIRFTTGYFEIPNLPWLQFNLELRFTTDEKGLWGNTSIHLGEFACIRPYFWTMGWWDWGQFGPGSPTLMDNFALAALHLECQIGRVTLRAGSNFTEITNFFFDRMGRPWRIPTHSPFIGSGNVPPIHEHCVRQDHRYEEFVGILAGGDPCCGEGFTFSAFVWFNESDDDGQPPSNQLFDIAEFDLDFGIDITEKFHFRFGVVSNEDDPWKEILIGFEVKF